MNILFVDEDDDAVKHFQLELESDGHNVIKISTIREAEREAMRPAWPFGLLILDVQIRPGPDEKRSEEESLRAGLTFYNSFRKRFQRAKVVILTHNLHRVPMSVIRDDPFTRAWDKVDVAGHLADEIRNFQA